MSPASGLFGELYLRSTRPFLPDHVSGADAAYLSARLAELTVEGPVLDIGCGHGRHLHRLQSTRFVVGLDLDALSLREVRSPAVRADFFALPFQSDVFAAAYAWYNTLFTVDDSRHLRLLRGVVRCVRPGGQLILQGTNGQWAKAQGNGHTMLTLEDGSRLIEEVTYNPLLERDEISRTLELTDGRVLSASFFIRYYSVDALEALLDEAGFKMRWVHGTLQGQPVNVQSPDLIVGAVKRP